LSFLHRVVLIDEHGLDQAGKLAADLDGVGGLQRAGRRDLDREGAAGHGLGDVLRRVCRRA
jgi:hypothetical protein